MRYEGTMRRYDCQACGACCCNTERNRSLGNREYIEVTPTERLYRLHRELLRKLGFRDLRGLWHLRLVGEEQRCIALDGQIGVRVACTIYPDRPVGCKKVLPGDDECMEARRSKRAALSAAPTG
jgi:Fe-S-cluster containining protein